MSVSRIANVNFLGNEASCIYCDRKIGELVGDKVLLRAFCFTHNYHNRVIRRCSKAKRHQRHRHHYQIYVDRMDKSYSRGRVTAARIDSEEEGQQLCRAKTPIWMNMAPGNYT